MLKPPPSVALIDGQSIRLKVGDHLAPDALRIHLHADPRRRGKLYRVPLGGSAAAHIPKSFSFSNGGTSKPWPASISLPIASRLNR